MNLSVNVYMATSRGCGLSGNTWCDDVTSMFTTTADLADLNVLVLAFTVALLQYD